MLYPQHVRLEKIRMTGMGGSIEIIGTLSVSWFGQEIIFRVVKDLPINVDGFLGSDFFEKFQARIDYEIKEMHIRDERVRIKFPMYTSDENCFVLDERCESIQKVKTIATEDCIIEPQEIAEGVFLAATIVKPSQGEIFVKVLNTRGEKVKINNLRPKIRPVTDYEICNFSKEPIGSERVDKLMNILDYTGLNSEEKSAVQSIVTKFADVFHLENDPATHTEIYKQPIHLKPDATPVYVRPYRIPHSQKAEVDRQVQQMLKNKIIEPAKSEWSSPILLVPKKPDAAGNKKWRLVLDYRRLNQNIEDDKFPLANITDIFDSLSGAVYFSTLDLSQGYYQVEIKDSDRPCTAFVTDKGQYQMRKLPMGLKISPSAFSRMMTIAMSGLNYDKCFVYLDDLICFGRNIEQHNKNLISVLQRLREVNLKLNPKKSIFLRKEVIYLGHRISAEGISPDPEKFEVMRNFPIPKNANETKRFVAFANYYRKFIKDFSLKSAPLNRLSKKDASFVWDNNCQKAFEILKNELTGPNVLDFPDLSENNEFCLTTDASKMGLGAVLSNSNGRPVAYASRALNAAEKNYNTTEIELLAIVWAVKHFRPYLFGKHFMVKTDHRPLVYLFGLADPSSRLNKFRMVLQEYMYTVVYVKGKENGPADALSRIEIRSEDLNKLQTQIVNSKVLAVTRLQKKLQEEQKIEEKKEKIEKQKSEMSGSQSDQLTTEPTICEILKRPKWGVELKILSDTGEEIKKRSVATNGAQNLWFVEKEQTLYLGLVNSTGKFDYAPILQEIPEFCRTLKINEIIVKKGKENRKLLEKIKGIKELLHNKGIKMYIIKGAQEVKKESTRKIILNDFHALPTGAHAGMNRMLRTMQKYYYWPKMEKDVQNFVKKCDACQRYKYSIQKSEPMVVTSTATTALSKIFLDIVGSIEKDEAGFSYILTMQCELSKYVVGVPLKNKETETVARAFVENFVLKYGIPQGIATDCGTEFLSEVMRKTCDLLQIKQLKSSAYHHETIGALENSHKNLGMYLRTQVAKHKNAWSSWVPYWCFAFNTTVHTETKYAPFDLVFGKNCELPSNLRNNRIEPLYNPDNYMQELRYRLKISNKEARENLVSRKEQRVKRMNDKVNLYNYKIGDLVMLKNEQRKKLDPIYLGPFEVLSDQKPNVEIKVKNKPYLVHRNRVKPYLLYLND